MAHYSEEDRNAAVVLRALGQALPENIEQSMGLVYTDEAEPDEEEQAKRVADEDVDEDSLEEEKKKDPTILIQRWFRRRKFRRLVDAVVFMAKLREKHVKDLLKGEQVFHGVFKAVGDLNVYLVERTLLHDVEAINVFAWAPPLEKISDVFLGRLLTASQHKQNRIEVASALQDYVKDLEDALPHYFVAVEKAIVILNQCEALNVELKKVVLKGDLRLKMKAPCDRVEQLAEAAKAILTCTPDLYPDHEAIRNASERLNRLRDAARESLAKMESNVKCAYFRHMSTKVDKPAHHTFQSKKNGRPRQCSTCNKVIWGIKGPNSECQKCVKCSAHVHTKCVSEAKDMMTCTEKKSIPLEGQLLLVERVFFLREGEMDMEAVLLVTNSGLFLSKITWASAEAAAKKDVLSAGDSHFDLISHLIWGSVNKIEAKLPPPGQYLRQIPVICGPWSLGAASREQAEQLVASLNKMKPKQ